MWPGYLVCAYCALLKNGWTIQSMVVQPQSCLNFQNFACIFSDEGSLVLHALHYNPYLISTIINAKKTKMLSCLLNTTLSFCYIMQWQFMMIQNLFPPYSHTKKSSCYLLTHLTLDKEVGQNGLISQKTFSDVFSWMKNFVFWLKFHWSLFLRAQLTITQHWFR